MTINEIKINNFGNLSDIHLTPGDGLNIIYAENGAGKSTLLNFIKFVFYGTKVKKLPGDLSFKEKYMPWNGMPMSGSIELTYISKRYTIYRSEGMKNGSKKLEIYDSESGERMTDISPADLMGNIDEKAFSGTFFISDVFSVTDSDIDSDIIRLLTDSTSEISYSKVKTLLSEKRSGISSEKRADSQINAVKSKLNKCNFEIIDVKNKLAENDELISKREVIKNDIEKLKHELRDADYCSNTLNNREDSLRELKMQKTSADLQLRELENKLDRCLIENEKRAGGHKSKTFITGIFLAVISSAVIFLSFTNVLNRYFIFAFAAGITGIAVGLVCMLKRDAIHHNDDSIRDIKNDIVGCKNRISEIKNMIKQAEINLLSEKNNTETDKNTINAFTKEELNDIICKKEDELRRFEAQLMMYDNVAFESGSLRLKLSDLEKKSEKLNNELIKIYDKTRLYDVAEDILDSAYSVMKSSMVPDISRDAYRIFSMAVTGFNDVKATGGDYSVVLNGELKSYKALSRGTADLLRLAIRLSVISALECGGDRVPVFMDDIFTSADDSKTAVCLDFIHSYANERQMFLTTCRSREGMYFADTDDVIIIDLKE